jgi:chaperonin GroES
MTALDHGSATSADEAPDTTPNADGSVPIKLLHDRVLVREDADGRERRSMGGIVIPVTAQVGRRLSWAKVVAIGPNVRSLEIGDRVLFEPEERGMVELRGIDYILLRERDVHAVAASRHSTTGTGLYL